MPTIAQKLCNDIVQPGIKFPGNVNGRSSGKLINSKSSTRNSAKSSNGRNGSLDRRKFSKFEPPLTSSKLRGYQSGVTVLNRNNADAGVNTHVTGPLRCDNNCVTSVRKRNHQATCKCMQNKKNSKVIEKGIQTLTKINYSLSDKACFQCVEQASCGTQFLEKRSSILKQVHKSDDTSRPPIKDLEEAYKRRCSHTSSKPYLRFISAKRWAVTKFPTRGPDF